MNINRNVLKIAACALLMVSLPAGAQVLGGSLGGTATGTLGSRLGGAGIDGAAGAAGHADASGAVGAARDRAQRAGRGAREVGASAVGTTRSRAESVRGAAEATVHTGHSAGVDASRRTVDSATYVSNSAAQSSASAAQSGTAQTSVQPNGGVLLNGSGAAGTEQRAMGRSVSAQSAAGIDASGDRSGLSGNANGQAGVSLKKDEPAP